MSRERMPQRLFFVRPFFGASNRRFEAAQRGARQRSEPREPGTCL
jgi:hypothetical protein